jgi:hypothetical protein
MHATAPSALSCIGDQIITLLLSKVVLTSHIGAARDARR